MAPQEIGTMSDQARYVHEGLQSLAVEVDSSPDLTQKVGGLIDCLLVFLFGCGTAVPAQIARIRGLIATTICSKRLGRAAQIRVLFQ